MVEESKFSWVNFYMEFADKLLEYKNNRKELIEKIYKIYDNIDINLPKLEENYETTDIEPFTIFGLFNKNIKTENKIKILKEIKELFSIKTEVPNDFVGIPELNPLKSTFYFFRDEREEDDIDNLWKIFEIALEYSSNRTSELRIKFIKAYDKVLKQKGIKWNITMGLFWIRPYDYINLDSRNRWFLTNKQFVKDKIINVIKPLDEKNTPPNGEKYLQICDKVNKYIKTENQKFKNFPELSYLAYVESYKDDEMEKENKNKKNKKSKKKNIEEEKTEGIGDPNPENELNYWLYSPGQSAKKWNKFYKNGIMGIGWSLTGDLNQFKSQNEIRKKLQEANGTDAKFTLDSLALWQFANEIKVGDIIFAKKGIHKILGYGVVVGSYFYDESFDNEHYHLIKVDWKEKGNWNYTTSIRKTLTKITDKQNMVDKLKDLFEDFDEVVEEPPIEYPRYSKEDFLEETFISEKEYNTLINLIKYKMNVIIEGAPGVGKTYISKRLAYSMIGVKDKNRVELVQFHQSYSYEDFIMGYRPAQEGFNLENGVFYNFCKKAEEDEENDYFFIIDEINRGNLSKIFGELFMLIEKDKRGNKIHLLYNDELFSIPKNLYIIGLMNTADRSLAILDYALRRRFSFYNLKPAFDSENFQKYKNSLNNDKFNSIIDLIKELNEEIKEDEVLGEGFQIGHSYFCNFKEDEVDEKLNFVINFEIIPLLKEYWFDEPNKVDNWSEKLKNALI